MSPRAKLPFGSHSAKKSYGKILTFYDRGGEQKVRIYNKPSGLGSEAQLAQRQIIKAKVAAWQALSVPAKASWNFQAKALGDPWSGYTLFMSIYSGGEDMSHKLLSAVHLDALIADVVRGDLIIGNSTPKWSRLAKGAAGKVLTMGAEDPSWETPAGNGDGGAGLGRLDIDEDFEALNLGTIHGQGSYTGWTSWAVTAPANTSAGVVDIGGGDGKILRLARTGGSASTVKAILDWNDADNNWGLTTGFHLRFKTRINPDNVATGRLAFKDLGDDINRFGVQFSASKFEYKYGTFSSTVTLWNSVDDTWYVVDMFTGGGAHGIRIMGDGDFNHYRAGLNAEDFDMTRNLGRIEFSISGGEGNLVFDIASITLYNLTMPA